MACNANPDSRLSSSARVAAQSIPADALVVTNGVVIDGTGTPPIRDGAVVIVQDKIFAVGPSGDFAISPQTQTIDAKGGTIMPGIINSHVHEAQSALIRKYYFLIRGVTSACDVGSPIEVMPEFIDKSYGLTARGFRFVSLPEYVPA